MGTGWLADYVYLLDTGWLVVNGLLVGTGWLEVTGCWWLLVGWGLLAC
jgi:hypothetical protein